MIASFFQKYDVDKNGSISCTTEFRELCDDLGLELGSEQQERAFSRYVDLEGSGTISLQEFQNFWTFMKNEHSFDLMAPDTLEWMVRCSEGFKYYNSSQSGVLSTAELHAFLPWLLTPKVLTPKEVADFETQIKALQHTEHPQLNQASVCFNSIVNWFLQRVEDQKAATK